MRFPVWYDTYPFAPKDFIDPDATAASEFTRDRRAYSCYTLAVMSLRDQPIPRAPFNEYFGLISVGTDFEGAAQAAFGMSDAEFTRQVRDFARGMHFQPRQYELRVELTGDDVPAWPEPEVISAERMHNILTSLASRMKGPATP